MAAADLRASHSGFSLAADTDRGAGPGASGVEGQIRLNEKYFIFFPFNQKLPVYPCLHVLRP